MSSSDDRHEPGPASSAPSRRVPDTSRTWFLSAVLFAVAGVIGIVGELPVVVVLLLFALAAVGASVGRLLRRAAQPR